MQAFGKVAVATALLCTSAVALDAQPAGAAVTTSVSGTQINVVVTGTTNVGFACVSGSVWVAGAFTSPKLACSALTKVSVTGDGSSQDISGGDLTQEPFTAHPSLVASTGAGADTVRETYQADQIDTGTGNDKIVLYPGGVANTSANAGADTDIVSVEGSPDNETVVATSTTTSVTLAITSPSGAESQTVTSAEALVVLGGGGNDVLNTSGITAASSIDATILDGGSGSNVMVGSEGPDDITTRSETDDITPGKGVNHVYDHTTLHAGGRAYHGTSGGITQWDVMLASADSVARVRAADDNTGLITTSLNRPGQQVGLTNSVTSIAIHLDDGALSTEPYSIGLADVHALPVSKNVTVTGVGGAKELVDIIVPSGSWTTTGNLGGTYTVKPAASGSAIYGTVVVEGINNVAVHAPWANYNEGWAHRVVRDLQFRFASNQERAGIRDAVGTGTKTRLQIVTQLMDNDVYRGLDVDRVFVKFLRRTSDPSGRTYWINSLEGGKPLITFRAQLFGSNEYFTKAGGTNAAYMVKAYNDVLGRQPDPSGQAYWTNKLNAGADRGSVAKQFLASTEARRNIVKDQYLRFLDRYPTTTTGGESETWVTKLAAPHGEEELIAALASGQEYQSRT